MRKKDEELFLFVIQILIDIVSCTGDVTLLTDGERRYGNLLFEICHEVIRTGKSGRPPKALPCSVKVRLKNRRNRTDETGQAHPKYEAPNREHPETVQDVVESDIHANHL
jgi:hypothetical protein